MTDTTREELALELFLLRHMRDDWDHPYYVVARDAAYEWADKLIAKVRAAPSPSAVPSEWVEKALRHARTRFDNLAEDFLAKEEAGRADWAMCCTDVEIMDRGIAALTSPPSPSAEPVAWRYHGNDDTWPEGFWQYTPNKPRHSDGVTVEPLYALPPSTGARAGREENPYAIETRFNPLIDDLLDWDAAWNSSDGNKAIEARTEYREARKRLMAAILALSPARSATEGATHARVSTAPAAAPTLRREAKHLVSSARAFLAHFNPTNLAEDKSQQWQALEHQCDLVDAAITAPDKGGPDEKAKLPNLFVSDQDREYAKNLLDDLNDDDPDNETIVAQWLRKVRVEGERAALRSVAETAEPVADDDVAFKAFVEKLADPAYAKQSAIAWRRHALKLMDRLTTSPPPSTEGERSDGYRLVDEKLWQRLEDITSYCERDCGAFGPRGLHDTEQLVSVRRSRAYLDMLPIVRCAAKPIPATPILTEEGAKT